MSEKDKFFLLRRSKWKEEIKKCKLSVCRHTPAIVAIYIERYHDVQLEDVIQ